MFARTLLFTILVGFIGHAMAHSDVTICEVISISSFWNELLKGLPAAFVALVIGGLASWIALHQYLVAKAKLKFDLFEKRLAIFNVTEDFLPKLMDTELSLTEINIFYRAVRAADFYFGKEIVDYLAVINEKAIMAHTIGLHLKANRGVMPPNDITVHTELSAWVADEVQSGLKQKFSKYLSFENWH